MCLVIFVQSDRRFGYTSSKQKSNCNVVSDGTGYYAYLPQYIVYRDSSNYSFHALISKKYPEADFFSMLKFKNGSQKIYNKFYTGTAIVQSPFYLVAHIIHVLFYGQGDGYSIGYRLSIQLAAMFYWVLGVIALFSLFQRLNYSRLHILIGIGCITFGTTLNYYVAYYTSYSHVYSFAFIALFLNFAQLWSKSNRFSHLLYFTIFLAIIAIIRPVNVLVIFIIPFFFENWKSFITRLKELFSTKIKESVIAILVGISIISIQLIIHHNQTDKWELYSYNQEGFTNIFHPKFWKMLFSYEKGFFVYSPLMLLLFPGIYFLFKKSSIYFSLGWLFLVLVSLYLVSSWWDWTYGGGFGMRVLIEYLPIYLFALLAFFEKIQKGLKVFSIVFVIGTLTIYQIFQFQYNRNILLYTGMNKDKFWKVFLKTDARYSWMLSYNYEHLPYDTLVKSQAILYKENHWEIPKQLDSSITIQTRKDELILINNGHGISTFGKLIGDTKIYNSANNPTIEAKYFASGIEIYSNLQPYGSQIEEINKFEKITLEFNPKLSVQPDSIRITLYHYGKRNDYKNLKYIILHK